MTNLNWEKIIRTAQAGDFELFNKAVDTLHHNSEYWLKLKNITDYSEDDTWEIFSNAMLKLKQKILEHTLSMIDDYPAYIFRIAQHEWIDLCRKRNRVRQIKYSPIDMNDLNRLADMMETLSENKEKLLAALENENHLFVALAKALLSIESTCYQIIERFYYGGEKLKDMDIPSIHQKKRRCLNNLKKLILKEL